MVYCNIVALVMDMQKSCKTCCIPRHTAIAHKLLKSINDKRLCLPGTTVLSQICEVLSCHLSTQCEC